MWIKAFRLQNFSSFHDTGEITLARGFNIFAGQNNSGKSAMLRALSLDVAGNPHRSPDAYRDSDLPKSRLEIDIAIQATELVRRLNVAGKKAFFPVAERTPGETRKLNNLLLSDEDIVLRFVKNPGHAVANREKSSIRGFEGNPNTSGVLVEYSDNRLEIKNQISTENLFEVFSEDGDAPIFYFSPERLNIGRQQFSTENKLNANASNLPAVLAYLQGSRGDIFRKIERHLVELMSGVAKISVTPAEGNNFEILVWPQEDTSRSELSFSLASSGTGVGQLLAILTAVVSVDQAVVIIDEINTFLHPTASKGLISLLRSEYPQHQYIISTHSSDVLSSAVSDRVFLIKRDGYASEVQNVDLGNFRTSREVAGHLGFSMMDVFGHDRLIWVEGQTEELCIPFLLRHSGIDTEGIGFVAVASTAEFSNRGASTKSVIDLYDKVAKASAPLLKGMAFGLDRERLSDEAVQKLERSKRKLKFLPRRALENFLIDPKGIAGVLNSNLEEAFTAEMVADWLRENGGNAEFGAASKWNGSIETHSWLVKVDAPRLLEGMFRDLSAHRLEFRKTTHSVEILKNILAEDKEGLQDLVGFAVKLIEIAKRDTKP
jgi:predicted ATPase